MRENSNFLENLTFYWPAFYVALIIISAIVVYLLAKYIQTKREFKRNYPHMEKLNAHWESFEHYKYRSDLEKIRNQSKSIPPPPEIR